MLLPQGQRPIPHITTLDLHSKLFFAVPAKFKGGPLPERQKAAKLNS